MTEPQTQVFFWQKTANFRRFTFRLEFQHLEGAGSQKTAAKPQIGEKKGGHLRRRRMWAIGSHTDAQGREGFSESVAREGGRPNAI